MNLRKPPTWLAAVLLPLAIFATMPTTPPAQAQSAEAVPQINQQECNAYLGERDATAEHPPDAALVHELMNRGHPDHASAASDHATGGRRSWQIKRLISLGHAMIVAVTGSIAISATVGYFAYKYLKDDEEPE